MTRDEKMNMQRRMKRRIWRKQGEWFALLFKLLLIIAYLIGAAWTHSKQDVFYELAANTPYISPVMQAVFAHAVLAYLLLGGIALVWLLLYPYGKKVIADQLKSIALVNGAGMPPELIRIRRDREHNNVKIWEFFPVGIPLIKWENCQEALETLLDVTIIKMTYHQGKSRIRVYAIPADIELPQLLLWNDSFLSPKSFVLTLGESLLGPVTVDLAKIPHILLGGSTGSGKSVLLKLLLMQAVKKGAKVCIADFKGGVDFPPVWHENCRMCIEESDLLKLLTELVDELERRKQLFREARCSNIDAYNKATDEGLQRYIFACDEVAEVLDRTNRSGAGKEFYGKIESKLSVIARQGRAFGIHLILATQRPDAALIPGQIRTNLDCRICGRADTILSEIILGDGEAARQIPKDARGRFLLHDGTLFQAYWFEENEF